MESRITADSGYCRRRWSILLLFTMFFLAACGGGGGGGSSDSGNAGSSGTANLTLAELGERIFFDTNLSDPVGQSCGTCHDPGVAFTDPENTASTVPVSDGADGVSMGTRNSPTASYAAFIPPFTAIPPMGGQFLDGRAATLEEQARAPFLNPVEMNMADEAAVVAKLAAASYADDFRRIFNIGDFSDVTLAYTQMVTAIAAFERTDRFSPFSSKFDAVIAGSETFEADELRGQTLFNGKAQCNLCHSSGGARPLFSDFRYSNIGVPANPAIATVDLGLGAPQALNNVNHNGKFRTPTLRNVALTAPYMHNGVFDTLEQVMVFYNERDAGPTLFTPEVGGPTVDNRGNLGELNLSSAEINDLIAFLRTLSDR